jgi:hypothetical protein
MDDAKGERRFLFEAHAYKDAFVIKRPDGLTDDEWVDVAKKLARAIQLGGAVLCASEKLGAADGDVVGVHAVQVPSRKPGELLN